MKMSPSHPFVPCVLQRTTSIQPPRVLLVRRTRRYSRELTRAPAPDHVRSRLWNCPPRFVPSGPGDVAVLIIGLLARADLVWSDRISVIDRRHIRQRPL